jgi:hypothetical protein
MRDTVRLSREVIEAGKRVHEKLVLHKLALGHEAYGKWFVVTLADGRSPDNDTLYPTRQAAVRYTARKGCERDCAYVPIKPGTSDARELATFLAVQRRMRDAGLAVPDSDAPGGGLSPIVRASAQDQYTLLRNLFKGDVHPSNLIYPRSN